MDILVGYLGVWAPAFLLVFARTAALFSLAPVIGSRAIPAMVRILIAFWISAAYLVTVKVPPPIPNDLFTFLLLIINSAMVGIVFGFAASILFYAIQGGGEMVASQASLSMMTTLNPLLRTQTSAVGQLFYFVAQITFILIGGHLTMIQGYFQTFQLVPINGWFYIPGAFPALVKITGALFITTLQFAMPAILVMFLIDFGLGMINRAAQQVSNILEMVMAIKPSLGFIIVLLMMPNLQAHINAYADQMVRDAVGVIQSAHPTPAPPTVSPSSKPR